jgi:hypothetical protein
LKTREGEEDPSAETDEEAFVEAAGSRKVQ